MGGPARPLHEPGNHRSSERCSHRHSADRGSLIGQPTLLRITAPTPWPGARSHLVIDGNSSPWSNLFQQLLTGSTVLKVESTRGLVQWYYDELRPWHNFVPIAPDISDLVDKVKWLNRNDRVAEAIGCRGFDLAKRLSYAREIARSVPTISAAIRDFTGLRGASGPYGRALS